MSQFEEISGIKPAKTLMRNVQYIIDACCFFNLYDGGSDEWYGKLIDLACDDYPSLTAINKDWILNFIKENDHDFGYSLAQCIAWCR